MLPFLKGTYAIHHFSWIMSTYSRLKKWFPWDPGLSGALGFPCASLPWKSHENNHGCIHGSSPRILALLTLSTVHWTQSIQLMSCQNSLGSCPQEATSIERLEMNEWNGEEYRNIDVVLPFINIKGHGIVCVRAYTHTNCWKIIRRVLHQTH